MPVKLVAFQVVVEVDAIPGGDDYDYALAVLSKLSATPLDEIDWHVDVFK
jgi:hypothetical protein